jgi:hypothetical protein
MKNHPINIGSNLHQALSTLPSTYATDGVRGDLPAVYIFTPDANATWVLWEYDPEEELAFGLCDLGLGFPELGYIAISELMNARGQFGLPVEIDKSVTTRFAGYERAGVTIPDWLQ